MKYLLSAILIFFLIGCKSKQSVATAAANDTTEVSKIIKGHYANEHDFKTLSIRANAKYEDEKQSHSMNADIRIKKDEIIWINIKFWLKTRFYLNWYKPKSGSIALCEH